MKKYILLDIRKNWKELLSSVTNKHIVLLNKSEDEFILAWGKSDEIIFSPDEFNESKFTKFLKKHEGNNFLFGYISYDLKNNETKNLKRKKDIITTNDLCFFSAKNVLVRKGNSCYYYGEETKETIEELLNETGKDQASGDNCIQLTSGLDRHQYINNVKSIKENIQHGNIYEMNYCVDFTGTFKTFNAKSTYFSLANNTNAPFSAYMQLDDTIILSGSPERYIKRVADTLISQPIKGTAKRGDTAEEDVLIKNELEQNVKEIAENVMIVDLVRNDLSKIAQKNTVQVSELCKPYSFKTVHQLISTIKCSLKDKVTLPDILQASFPMGSMTGAPKVSAMQHIDAFENFNRGIYSGTIGYIDPNGNFDFNVVIRTLTANMKEKTLQCGVGGAITIKSDPEKEYDECLLKLNAIQNALC